MINAYVSYQIISTNYTDEEKELEGEIDSLLRVIADKQNKLSNLRKKIVSDYIGNNINNLDTRIGNVFYNETTNKQYFISNKSPLEVTEMY